MDNNLSEVAFITLSAYTAPAITEAKKGAYVEYGDDNNYFQYLIDRYLYSPTNSSIITGIGNMIKYRKEYGEDRYRPNALLRKMVRENKTFY